MEAVRVAVSSAVLTTVVTKGAPLKTTSEAAAPKKPWLPDRSKTGGYFDLRLVLLVPIGVDSLLCFAVLSAVYLLFIKSSKREGK
jgi:hypothetical protein